MTDFYAIFSGSIDQNTVQKITHSLACVTQDKSFTKYHLMFQSSGGTVGDGVCLYNFFKNYPIDLAIYNTGNCASAAVISFCGARTRIAVATASFMLHPTYFNAVGAVSTKLESANACVKHANAATEAILLERVRLTRKQLSTMRSGELYLNATEAVSCGIATEIGNFLPPRGVPIISIVP